MAVTVLTTNSGSFPSPLPHQSTHVLLNGTTVASPPHAEARGVRWPRAQHAQEERHHPSAGLHPEEHGEYPATHALFFCCRSDREGKSLIVGCT